MAVQMHSSCNGSAEAQWRGTTPCPNQSLPIEVGRRGATLHPRYGAAATLCRSSREEIPHVQGKRKPNKRVGTERGNQRADRLKPQSQTTSQSVTRIIALSNSMKLSHALWGHPRRMGHGGVNVVHWRREWQTTSVFLPWEPHEQYEKAKR